MICVCLVFLETQYRERLIASLLRAYECVHAHPSGFTSTRAQGRRHAPPPPTHTPTCFLGQAPRALIVIDLVAFPESYRRLLCFPGVFLADACLLAYFLLAKLTGGGRAGPADGGRRRKAGSHLHACGRVADSSIPNCQGKERVVGSNGVEKECPRSIA
jgi:hypothetical protein